MTDKPFVDPNTENLDDFNDLLFGRADAGATSEETHEEEVEDDVLEQDETPVVDTEDDALELEEDEAPAPKPKRKTAQDRINELTADKYERDRALETEKAARVALEARLAELEKTAPKPVPVQDKTGPNPTELLESGEMKYPLGEFDPAFIRDLTRFTIDEEQKAATVRAQEQAQTAQREQARVELQNNWQGKIVEYEKEAPDFREKAGDLLGTFAGLDPAYGDYLAQTIMSMDNGTQILYHLANNKAEAVDIVSKGAVGATIALGRLEARFAESSKPKPRASQAPAKTPPTARGVAANADVRGDTDDLDDFEEVFFAPKRGQRRRK